MRRELAWLLAVLIVAALLGPCARPPRPKPYLGTYAGIFQWDHSAWIHQARFTFDRSETDPVSHRVVLYGHGRFTIRDESTYVRLRAVVSGLQTTIRESSPRGPGSPFFDLDGEYRGGFSPDGAHLDAVWRSTAARRGQLRLNRYGQCAHEYPW